MQELEIKESHPLKAFPLHVQNTIRKKLNFLGQRTAKLAFEPHRARCTVLYNRDTLKRTKPIFVVGCGGVNIKKACLAQDSTHSGPRYHEAFESWMDPRTD